MQSRSFCTFPQSENVSEIDENWLEWFIGFADAECNFQTFPSFFRKRESSPSGETFPKKRERADGTTYYNVGYGFNLGLHLQDKELIYQIHNKLGNRGKISE